MRLQKVKRNLKRELHTKQEMLPLCCYHCYRKEPFPSPASNAAQVLTKFRSWLQPSALLLAISAKHSSPDRPTGQTRNLQLTINILIYSTPCQGNATTFTGSRHVQSPRIVVNHKKNVCVRKYPCLFISIVNTFASSQGKKKTTS